MIEAIGKAQPGIEAQAPTETRPEPEPVALALRAIQTFYDELEAEFNPPSKKHMILEKVGRGRQWRTLTGRQIIECRYGVVVWMKAQIPKTAFQRTTEGLFVRLKQYRCSSLAANGQITVGEDEVIWLAALTERACVCATENPPRSDPGGGGTEDEHKSEESTIVAERFEKAGPQRRTLRGRVKEVV